MEDFNEEYFNKIENWYKNNKERIFVIGGYAGCGKTTLAKQIPEFLKISNYRFLAPTGKAATVLGNAQTIHSYLYRAYKDEETKKLYFIKKGPEFFNEKLLIIDEISMVNESLLNDLKSIKIPIIGLGDPGQLPPVEGKSYILENPDIFLTKVYRYDGGLLDLATDIRLKKQLKSKYDKVEFNLSKIFIDKLVEYDEDSIVICRFNETRKIINYLIRTYLYDFNNVINKGDKLIILKNNMELGLFNGSIVKVLEILYHNTNYNFMDLKVLTDDNMKLTIRVNLKTILNLKSKMDDKNKDVLDCDYAYAITCHKAQGSEFKKVFLIKQGHQFTDWVKWFYTGVTRAKELLYIFNDVDNLLKELIEELDVKI